MTGYICPDATPGAGHVYAGCASQLFTTTEVVVLDNLFNQKTLSTKLYTPPSRPDRDPVYEWEVAYPIQIRWRSEDLVDPTTSGTAPPTPTSTPEPSSNDGNTNSLSAGAIAGIVIGAVVGVSLIIAATIAVFVVVRRRRRAAAYGPLHREQQSESQAPASLESSPKYSAGPQELEPSPSPPQELSAEQHRYYELR